MKTIVHFAICYFLLLTFAINAGEVRTWSSGKFETQAEFVKLSEDGQIVTLRKIGGKEIKVPHEKLSKGDQDFITRKMTLKSGPPRPKMPTNIVTKQDCIDAILSDISDAEDRGVVLKWLKMCDALRYDKVAKHFFCTQEFPIESSSSKNSFVQGCIFVIPKAQHIQVAGSIIVRTCDNSALFPKRITVVDDGGKIWTSPEKQWTHNADIFDKRVWVTEYHAYSFPSDFSGEEIDDTMNAITKNKECVIRIYGNKGYRDIEISPAKAKEMKAFYDAYIALKKYYKYYENR